jgi:hypothetical protein
MATEAQLSAQHTDTDKEFNFTRLREKADRLEREKRDLELALQQQNHHSSQSRSASFLKEAGITGEEPFVETSKLPDLIAAVTKHTEEKTQQIVQQALQDYQSRNMYTYMQAETGGQFSQVVNEISLEKLQKEEPEIAIAINALENDPAAKASFLYKKCLRMKDQEEQIKQMQDRATQAVRSQRNNFGIKTQPSEIPRDRLSKLESLPMRGTPEALEAALALSRSLPRPSLFTN